MTRIVTVLMTLLRGSQLEEEAGVPGEHEVLPGPRKKEPIITSTAHDIMNIVKMEMANFRSSGLLEGFRSV